MWHFDEKGREQGAFAKYKPLPFILFFFKCYYTSFIIANGILNKRKKAGGEFAKFKPLAYYTFFFKFHNTSLVITKCGKLEADKVMQALRKRVVLMNDFPAKVLKL